MNYEILVYQGQKGEAYQKITYILCNFEQYKNFLELYKYTYSNCSITTQKVVMSNIIESTSILLK